MKKSFILKDNQLFQLSLKLKPTNLLENEL